jgi:hypothetical protein
VPKAAKAPTDSFRVDLNGLTLSEDQKVKLAGAIQGAALSALATFDARGDHIAIAFPRNGGTRGIWIYERDLLEGQLPQLSEQLDKLRRQR